MDRAERRRPVEVSRAAPEPRTGKWPRGYRVYRRSQESYNSYEINTIISHVVMVNLLKSG